MEQITKSYEEFLNVNAFIYNRINNEVIENTLELRKKILSELETKKEFIPILNKDHFKYFNVYGLGAVGSWFFRLLSKPLVISNIFDINQKNMFSIYLKDFDSVEPHNVLAQDFFINDLGLKKNTLIRDVFNISEMVNSNQLYNTAEDSELDFTRLTWPHSNFKKVFAFNYLFVDSMNARTTIFNNLIREYDDHIAANVKLPFFNFLIDTRISAQTVHIYCIDLNNKADIEYYRQTLYQDSVANQDTCSLAPHLETGIFAANMAMKFTNHIILNSDEPFIEYSRFKDFNLNLFVL